MNTGSWRRWRLALGAGALGLLAAACTAATSKPGETSSNKKPAASTTAATNNRYKIKSDAAPFYKLGPQQPGGPDLSLKRNTHLTLIKRSYGYSQVQLDADGGNGIVGNEDLAPLTPQELAAEQAPVLTAANSTTTAGGGTGAKNRRRSSPRLPFNAPLPPGSEPSLPGSESSPARTEPTPAFRY